MNWVRFFLFLVVITVQSWQIQVAVESALAASSRPKRTPQKALPAPTLLPKATPK